MLVTIARKKTSKNARTSKNGENDKNKDEDLGINLVQISYIQYCNIIICD